MTIPATPAPDDGTIRTPVDFKLKPGWHFDAKRRSFESATGETFSVRGELPKGSRIVHTAPNLAHADVADLNEHELELRRYMQLILPHGEAAGRYLATVLSWPAVEEATIPPRPSLPQEY